MEESRHQMILKSMNTENPLDLYEPDCEILGDGTDCVFSSDSEKTGINDNKLVVGGSGSGKTLSVLEAILMMTSRRSLITTVTKRRIVSMYSQTLKNRGYDILDLDFVHPQRGDCGYDPLDFIFSYQDIPFIARSIILANPKKEHSIADPYWDEAATSLLCALITYVKIKYDNPSFEDVLVMINTMQFEEYCGQIRTNYDQKFEILEKKDPSNFAVTNWNSFKKLPIKTAGCVFGTLNTTIDSVFTPELRKMFKMKKKIDFRQLAQKRTVLFVTSSPVNPNLNCFINMFYSHAFKQLFEYGEDLPDGKLPIPVHILADDFATGCPVPLFDQYISIFREKGISATLLIQSESQLASLYGQNQATTIINNCDTYIFMGANDLTTARNISIRANKPLEDILHMKVGREILFRRGEKPRFCNRFNILENEMYQRIRNEYSKKICEEKNEREFRKS